MRSLSCLIGMLVAGGCYHAAADAASISLVPFPGNVHAFYVSGESLNGAFDAVFFRATPGGAAFINNSFGLVTGVGIPRTAGQAFTFPNRMLGADPSDFEGGLNLSLVDLTNTPQELSLTVKRVGGTISTANQPGGKLFLGNVVSTRPISDGSVTVQLFREGQVVYDGKAAFIPEPSSLALISAAGSVCAWGRRRYVE